MRYDSVQNAEIHFFCSENRNFMEKEMLIFHATENILFKKMGMPCRHTGQY